MSPRHKFMSLPYYYYDLCRVLAQLLVRTDRLSLELISIEMRYAPRN
jgi:hypothetical protein